MGEPGEAAAARQLQRFCTQSFAGYDAQRNRPDRPGTFRLSPHLHWGELSARQVWHGVRRFAERTGLAERVWRHSQFLAELGWREFSLHLLHQFPDTPTQPLRPDFARFPWRTQPDWPKAWQKGRTGY